MIPSLVLCRGVMDTSVVMLVQFVLSIALAFVFSLEEKSSLQCWLLLRDQTGVHPPRHTKAPDCEWSPFCPRHRNVYSFAFVRSHNAALTWLTIQHAGGVVLFCSFTRFLIVLRRYFASWISLSH